jgi:hypothetical protein
MDVEMASPSADFDVGFAAKGWWLLSLLATLFPFLLLSWAWAWACLHSLLSSSLPLCRLQLRCVLAAFRHDSAHRASSDQGPPQAAAHRSAVLVFSFSVLLLRFFSFCFSCALPSSFCCADLHFSLPVSVSHFAADFNTQRCKIEDAVTKAVLKDEAIPGTPLYFAVDCRAEGSKVKMSLVSEKEEVEEKQEKKEKKKKAKPARSRSTPGSHWLLCVLLCLAGH